MAAKTPSPEDKKLRRWTSWEVVRERAQTSADRFVSDLIVSGTGDEVVQVLRKMRLLEGRPTDGFGWPAKNTGLSYDKVKVGTETVWYLRGGKGCWRAYFWPDDANARIIYLHIRCKKKWGRRPEDAGIAARRLQDLRGGRLSIARLELPDQFSRPE